MVSPIEIIQRRAREKKQLREGSFRKIKEEYHGFPMSQQAEHEWKQKIDEAYNFLGR